MKTRENAKFRNVPSPSALKSCVDVYVGIRDRTIAIAMPTHTVTIKHRLTDRSKPPVANLNRNSRKSSCESFDLFYLQLFK